MKNRISRAHPKRLLGLSYLLGVTLLLSQCNENSSAQTKTAPEVTKHFAGMNYTEFRELGSQKSPDATQTTLMGSGVAKISSSERVPFKWMQYVDSDGSLGTGYIGTANMQSSWVVGLSRDEANREKSACINPEKTTSEISICIGNLINKVISDCENAGPSESECLENCWYDPGYCEPEPDL